MEAPGIRPCACWSKLPGATRAVFAGIFLAFDLFWKGNVYEGFKGKDRDVKCFGFSIRLVYHCLEFVYFQISIFEMLSPNLDVFQLFFDH